VNLAAIWQLPVIFVCENNQYGASTNVHDVMRTATIAERAACYGIRGEQVDGNAVLDVLEATRRAAAECRDGKGPVLLELLTYRFAGHSRRDARHYQPPGEQQEWMAKDPIRLMAGLLTERGIADDAELEQRRQAILDEFNRAVEVARDAQKPDPARELLSHVFSEKEDSR
jgi:pyruvate dehydrogenase E1 component alpha subunit